MENKKNLKSLFYKCPNCGSGMVFSAKEQKLFCSHCNTTEDFEKLQENTKHNLYDLKQDEKSYDDWKQQEKIFKCNNCGADVSLGELQYAGKCPYCTSAFVAEKKELPNLKPDTIIPFCFDEEQAQIYFRTNVKKKFFVPTKFKKAAKAENIKRIYVPCFKFDANTKTDYHGVLQEQVTGSKGETTVHTYTISGQHNAKNVDFLIANGSNILQENLKELFPYDMTKAFKFSGEFVVGYEIEHYRKAFNDCYKECQKAMEESIKSSILRKYSYSNVVSFSMHTIYSEEKYAYSIVPVYQLDFVYRGKNYIANMNGQTGKIGGKLPKSGLKIFIVVFLIAVIVAVLAYFSLR